METQLDHRMAAPGQPPGGKHLKCPQRKRTVFTEKQLTDLKLLFKENPYPSLNVQREMASKMEIHPTVLQVWFKNYRARVKKARSGHRRPTQPEAAEAPRLEGGLGAPPPGSSVQTPPRQPRGAGPTSLVYTHLLGPSFQLRLCPPQKSHTDHATGHRVVHFGCCQDPNIYCLAPILDPQEPLTSSPAYSLGSLSPP
ncbi:PREDICTED: divergent paired-related homeobox [Condylura cristata]|uniref:divergent paired-related homeobox n=1 Tax=Condylura cristata TaxID=143302 RepID=UPI0003343A9E|nr:PREDICTED: divergent paired-related homeobox [Condylura cristata]